MSTPVVAYDLKEALRWMLRTMESLFEHDTSPKDPSVVEGTLACMAHAHGILERSNGAKTVEDAQLRADINTCVLMLKLAGEEAIHPDLRERLLWLLREDLAPLSFRRAPIHSAADVAAAAPGVSPVVAVSREELARRYEGDPEQ